MVMATKMMMMRQCQLFFKMKGINIMFKKYLTIMLVSLISLLPAISYSHHYGKETEINNFINLSSWLSTDISNLQIIDINGKTISKLGLDIETNGYDEDTLPIPSNSHTIDEIQGWIHVTFYYTDGTSDQYTVIPNGNGTNFDWSYFTTRVYRDVHITKMKGDLQLWPADGVFFFWEIIFENFNDRNANNPMGFHDHKIKGSFGHIYNSQLTQLIFYRQ